MIINHLEEGEYNQQTTMNPIQQAKQLESFFTDLVYNDDKHSYTVNDQVLTSVTTFTNSFKAPFETFQVSTFVAKAAAKHNKPIDPAYYRQQWALRGKIAAMIGTSTHLYLQQAPYFDTPSNKYEEAGLAFFHNEIEDQQEIVAQELKMYCKGLGGTLDLLTKQGDDYTLFDFKTNADLNKSYGKMLRQFSAFNDSPINLYSIQQTLYAHILKEMCDITVKEAFLVHLKPDGTYQLVGLNPEIVALTKTLLKRL